MIRDDLEEISEDEFNNLIGPIDDKILKYVKDNFLNEYIAYYLKEYYQNNALFKESINLVIDGAINLVSQFKFEDCDINKVKEILKDTYDLTLNDDKDINIVG